MGRVASREGDRFTEVHLRDTRRVVYRGKLIHQVAVHFPCVLIVNVTMCSCHSEDSGRSQALMDNELPSRPGDNGHSDDRANGALAIRVISMSAGSCIVPLLLARESFSNTAHRCFPSRDCGYICVPGGSHCSCTAAFDVTPAFCFCRTF